MKSQAKKLQQIVEEKYETEAIHKLFADEVHGEKFAQTNVEDLPKISLSLPSMMGMNSLSSLWKT